MTKMEDERHHPLLRTIATTYHFPNEIIDFNPEKDIDRVLLANG